MKKSVLCMLSALVLMAAVFRVGYQVEVNGAVLPGVYAPATVRQSAGDARRAAEEICRTEEAPPFRLRPVLCARYTAADGQALTRAMLNGYDGVSVLYAVYAGPDRIGTTDDPGLPGTIYEESMAAQAMTGPRRTVPLTMKKVFTYSAAVTDVMALSRSIGQAVQY